MGEAAKSQTKHKKDQTVSSDVFGMSTYWKLAISSSIFISKSG
jgi:hypothetical protein